MTSSLTGADRSRLAPAPRREKLPIPCPGQPPRKLKGRRQLTCAGAEMTRWPSPGGRDQARRPPPRVRLPRRPRVTEVERAGPVPPHGLSVISLASAQTGDPARPARPSVARGGAPRLASAPAEAAREEARATGPLSQTRRARRERRPRPHPPRAPGAQADGGRGRGAATVAAAAGPRPRCPHATPHRGPNPPALLPRPGLHTPMRRRRRQRREAWLAPHR